MDFRKIDYWINERVNEWAGEWMKERRNKPKKDWMNELANETAIHYGLLTDKTHY